MLSAATVAADDHLAAAASLEKSAAVVAGAVSDSQEAVRARRLAERKLAESVSKCERIEKEKDFLKSLNDNLIVNQKQFQERLKAAETALAEKEAASSERITELEEQVRDLMVYIEAQQAVASSGGLEGLRDGTVLSVPKPPTVTTPKAKLAAAKAALAAKRERD